MKNVVVFRLGEERRAVELRWVGEVVTLGHVTPVPSAPSQVVGATNVHGSIVPVLRLSSATGPSALLVEARGTTFAIAIAAVEEVSTLESHDGDTPAVADSSGRRIDLISPQDLADEVLGESAGE